MLKRFIYSVNIFNFYLVNIEMKKQRKIQKENGNSLYKLI
jgi:hypothetical protein